MTAGNKTTIKKISPDNPTLPNVIQWSVGCPTYDKIRQVIESYQNANQHLIGAFDCEKLIGIVGIEKIAQQITIRHISVLPSYRKRGIGKAIINFVIRKFTMQQIVTETDDEAVDFYRKFGFVCYSFNGKYGNLRYRCYYDCR
ncbi:GNAT family N-acetyltransferase [Wolbachia endosymbiont of Ctenocephalides felis wCfeT]|uniref:GNAT family N-acetyltransferase n=1 Tax=Wolbachia endosymbiont of Ctenocephalides felis wCfeT TaxID=2732593 RepID=UPI001445C1A3|nr:GNAT family N-acetyltransferase [Wolbachia endosymbiont of Ctenocephalides felis wCfeT]